MTNEDLRQARPVDEARAARLVLATLTGDGAMFALAAQQVLEDPFRADVHGAVVGTLFVLSEILATSMAVTMGRDDAVAHMQSNVMQWALKLEAGDQP